MVFHDIVESPKTPDVQVYLLWRLLKTYLPHVEFVAKGIGYGIGVASNAIQNLQFPIHEDGRH